MNVKHYDLNVGDVVEFMHNGQHEKTRGIVIQYLGKPSFEADGRPKRILIQCDEYVTGVFGRNYKVCNQQSLAKLITI